MCVCVCVYSIYDVKISENAFTTHTFEQSLAPLETKLKVVCLTKNYYYFRRRMNERRKVRECNYREVQRQKNDRYF